MGRGKREVSKALKAHSMGLGCGHFVGFVVLRNEGDRAKVKATTFRRSQC